MKKFCMTLVTLAVALSGTVAFAKDKKDHEKGWERHREERKEARKDDRREHWQQRESHHHEREHHKAFARHNQYRPPGWDHGKKVGWGTATYLPDRRKRWDVTLGGTTPITEGHQSLGSCAFTHPSGLHRVSHRHV